jgi:ppGpp synthetase/RelA/SpoT-type nucleotidyltranferase
MHAYPMTKVTMGIRSMVRTATRDESIRPGQRFKRMDRIVDKLLRYPRMRLSQMEDIGGCRVVLPDIESVYRALARVQRQWGDSARLTDYIAAPKEDGYRGIHVIERRDGRLVEVQLRTRGQHQWAEAIEAWGPRLGFNLKDGEGPDLLRRYFQRASIRIALGEAGEPADERLEAEFDTLRRRVRPYFERYYLGTS